MWIPNSYIFYYCREEGITITPLHKVNSLIKKGVMKWSDLIKLNMGIIPVTVEGDKVLKALILCNNLDDMFEFLEMF